MPVHHITAAMHTQHRASHIVRLLLPAMLSMALISIPAPLRAQTPVAAPAAPSASTWYVDGAGGADGGSCGSQSAPCQSIQAAIDKASSGDTILVAGSANGIIYTFAGSNACTNDAGTNSVICVLRKKVTIKGGYAAGDWNTYDPVQNLTILDGQGRNRVVWVLGYGAVSSTSLTIEGVTVRNGYGVGISKRPGEDAYFGYGGGMYVELAGSIVVRDVRFASNRAVGSDRSSGYGGGGAGGALFIRRTTSVSLDGVTFEDNQALGGVGPARGGVAHGGALFTYYTTLEGNNLVFRNNLAQAGSSSGDGESRGRADALGGGGNFQEESVVTLRNVQASGNRAIGGNAAVNAGGGFGGAFESELATVVSITDADIRNNTAQGGDAQNGWFGVGGGIMVIDTTLNLDRVVVIDNTAQGGNGTTGKFGVPNGGGVMASWATDGATTNLNITNSIIAGNKARKGAGTQIEIGGGGGLWIQATTAVIDHTTVADNELIGGVGLLGQGFFILNTGSRRGANVTIRRSLITGHDGPEGSAVEIVKNNTVSFEGGLFFGNSWDSSATYPAIAPGDRGTLNGLDTMQNGDPRYVDPGSAAFDYHIKSNSAARNQAGVSQPVDVDNEPRSDGKADYGADEYTPPPRPPLMYNLVASDLNTIHLGWDLLDDLAGSVVKYQVTDRYTPNGGAGGMIENVFEVGLNTNHIFEDLDPYVMHLITIDALDASNNVVVSGGEVAIMPTDQRVHLPLLRR